MIDQPKLTVSTWSWPWLHLKIHYMLISLLNITYLHDNSKADHLRRKECTTLSSLNPLSILKNHPSWWIPTPCLNSSYKTTQPELHQVALWSMTALPLWVRTFALLNYFLLVTACPAHEFFPGQSRTFFQVEVSPSIQGDLPRLDLLATVSR